jgi:hypothetical protein
MEKETTTKWYEENAGTTSAVRISLIIGLFMGFILAGMVVYTRWDAGIFLPVSIWTTIFTGKVAQKFGEK